MYDEQRLIELRGVSKSFGDTQVLHNIDLYIRKREFVTLLGPSGCGKTTMLRIIGGFEMPTEGSVIFEDKDITDVPPYRRRVNTVFQKYALFTHLNVFDNIAFGLKLRKLPKAEIAERVRALAPKGEASFLIERLDYMRKGGRCSAVAALGANLLHLKPCIEVRNGKMAVCKKYRGSFEKCIRQYVKERLDGREDIAPELAFITHAAADANVVAAAKEEAAQYGSFETVEETQAGCTVSCHCGPNTLGILFVRK